MRFINTMWHGSHTIVRLILLTFVSAWLKNDEKTFVLQEKGTLTDGFFSVIISWKLFYKTSWHCFTGLERQRRGIALPAAEARGTGYSAALQLNFASTVSCCTLKERALIRGSLSELHATWSEDQLEHDDRMMRDSVHSSKLGRTLFHNNPRLIIPPSITLMQRTYPISQ